jgi:pyruvate/2-oxoacid:ferredoxin oxidoreductase alpha subunit
VYNEFDPGVKQPNDSSYAARAAAEFNLLSLPWMVEGEYRQWGYQHNTTAILPAGTPCTATFGVAAGEPGCVTLIGGVGQVYVPAFSPKDNDVDGRLGLKVLDPRVYIGVSYLGRWTNYGYPRQSGVGFGLEKLPDLDTALSVYGSAYYYPQIKGTCDTNVCPTGPFDLEYRIFRYSVGATYSIPGTPVFIEAGWIGDNGKNKLNAPSDFSHNAGTVAAWYPITPSTSVMDAFRQFCEKYRRDRETGRNNYCIIQAEDELAAIGMVIGASWNGARAFTSTSGPGISLMNELLGLAYYSEIPAVVIDVQRVGPSTGMPTRTQQADLLECAYASHGDTKHILLLPANPAECFEFAAKAFDLAERFQTPVIMLSDLDIGMNDWVVPRLKWDDSYRPDRGRVLSEEDLQDVQTFYRYTGENLENVTPRTVPGVHPSGAYVTRGSGHNKFGGYTETPHEYQEVVDRLARKHKSAASVVPAPKTRSRENATFGIATIGGCDRAVEEAVDLLAKQGVRADYMRICGFPFHESVDEFLNRHPVTFVVEQNRDAQLRALLLLETSVSKEKLRSVLVYGGFPLSARRVVEEILKQLESDRAVNR